MDRQRERDDPVTPVYTTEPSSLPLGDVTVSAVVAPDRSNNRWTVTVVLSRAPDQPPILGEELDARLLDERGADLRVVERPRGPLTEAGGSMMVSANGVFRFATGAAAPVELHVSRAGETRRFRLTAAPGS